jgi:hypothetical protein
MHVAALMQSMHTWSAPLSEKLVDKLLEKLEKLAVPEPIEHRDKQVVSLMPVSHPQMCMQAAVTSACEGRPGLEPQASTASVAAAAQITAMPIRVTCTA